MDGIEALKFFIRNACIRHRKERYLELIKTKNGRWKFLDDLWHQMQDAVKESKCVNGLSEKEWNTDGYLFSPASDDFAKPVQSIKTAYEEASAYGGWLIINKKGNIAVHQPEDSIDDELFIKL